MTSKRGLTESEYEQKKAVATKIVTDTLASPKSPIYFDPMFGGVTPEDDYIGDTRAGLKAAIKALKSGKEVQDSVYDDVERLLSRYFFLVRHGVTKHERRTVRWELSADGRISFYDEGEWFDDYMADEVPLWLLLTILGRIQRKKPLGDQDGDETIKAVRDIEYDFSTGARR